jgi:hypothetical protein
MYVIEHGAIPAGLDVMHKCDNPPCCNPSHLELGTRKQNLQDSAARGRHPLKAKTHCKRGHLLSGDNIYISGGTRHCKPCERERGPSKRPQFATHCPKGHELIGANLYVTPDGYRKCRPCRSASAMRWRPKQSVNQV